MTAAALVADLRARGVALRLVGEDRLALESAEPIPEAVVERVRACKPALLALLRPRPLPVRPLPPAELLAALAAAGAGLWLRGGELLLDAPEARREELRLVVLSMRAELVDLLEAFEERVAIMQHEGGLTRAEAEALAWPLLSLKIAR